MSFGDLITNLKDYMHYMTLQRFGAWLIGFFLSLCIFVAFSIKRRKVLATKDLAKVGVLAEINLILVITLVGRDLLPMGIWKWSPFWSYKLVFVTGDMKLLTQIILNILIFIPSGLLLPCCSAVFKKYRYIFVVTGVFSCAIEFIQGIALLGWFEVDDIMNNLFGTAIGVGMYAVYRRLWKNEREVIDGGFK